MPTSISSDDEAALEHYLASPGSLAATALQGFLRLEAGDAAGALVYLERTEFMPLPFGFGPGTSDMRAVHFGMARANGKLRRVDEAARLIQDSVRVLRYPLQVTNEPWFRTDWGDPNTLPRQFQQLAEAIELSVEARRQRARER